MGIFHGLFSKKKSDMVVISKVDLEEAIFNAICRAEKAHADAEKLRLSKDPISLLIRIIVIVFAGTFCLFSFLLSGMTIASFLTSGIVRLASLYAIDEWLRWILVFVGVGYGGWAILIIIATFKETDRSFLLSFFSAITAIVALFVAMPKPGK